jgi:large repetitive protein
VTAQLLDSSGVTVATLLDEKRPAGNNTFTWDASAVPDGRYTLAVAAAVGTRRVAKSVPVVVDRALTGLVGSATAISPNGDGNGDNVSFSFTLTQDVPVRFEVQQAGAVVATLFSGQLGVGAHTLGWDGTAAGAVLPDGAYTLVATVTDALGDVAQQLPLTIDTVPPVLTLLDAQTLRFSLSEPATVTLVVNQGTHVVKAEPKGSFSVPFPGPVVQVSATAQDAAGNISAPVSG